MASVANTANSDSHLPILIPSTASDRPRKLTRYHHHSHPHKLFQTIIRNTLIFCDNQNCKRRLHNNEVDYVCFRCNFDLCSHCFSLPTEFNSVVELHESDTEVNEDVDFVPDRAPIRAKFVCINPVSASDTKENEEEDDEEDDDDDEDEEEDDEEEKKEPHESQNVTLTFEGDNYDWTTTRTVNQLISQGPFFTENITPNLQSTHSTPSPPSPPSQ